MATPVTPVAVAPAPSAGVMMASLAAASLADRVFRLGLVAALALAVQYKYPQAQIMGADVPLLMAGIAVLCVVVDNLASLLATFALWALGIVAAATVAICVFGGQSETAQRILKRAMDLMLPPDATAA